MNGASSRRLLRGIGALLIAAPWLSLLSPVPAGAHDGPEHEIEEITVLISARGETSELLLQRAIEYGVLGKYTEAQQDLEHALRLDPASLHALRELARVQFIAGRTNEAIATVTRALNLKSGEPIDRGGLHILRSEFLRSSGDLPKALDDCQAGLRLHGSNPEWYLLRSELQRRLNLTRKRLAGIEKGIARTGAGVLEIERVEALLDDGQYRAALRWIEPELATSRIQCRWWVRRGRARLGLGQKAAGEADLRAALDQIEALLNPARIDASLLLDQATALVLLGDLEGARRCLGLARDHGVDAAVTARIQALLDPPARASARR